MQQLEADANGLLVLRRSGDGSSWSFSDLPGVPLDSWPLRLVEDPTAGRYLIAARDLKLGECVCTEEPFVQTVHDDLQETVCHHCYSLLADGAVRRVCERCGQIRFCSAACAQACAPVHAVECGLLSALAGNPTARKGVRGLRLFVRLVHTCSIDARGFECVEQLTEHYTHADEPRRKFLDGMAAQINKIVPAGMRMESGRLARLVSRVHTNLHAVADMAGVQYGSALYPRYGSLLNHSCAPTAAVSFMGRTWRLHMLKDVRAGQEVSISYTELYAGRDERRSSLRAKKAFDCACARCERPPASDTRLEGWKCAAASCAEGVLGSFAPTCGTCGVAHALEPRARAAIEGRWREAVDQGTSALLNREPDSSGGDAVGAATRALRTVDQMLSQSETRLCDDHMLRHKAHRLRVYALNLLPERRAGELSAELSEALQLCVSGMSRHLPEAHPELAFYRHWLAKALAKQAAAQTGSKSKGARAALQERAKAAAKAAVEGLAVAYGTDHPTVAKWRDGGDAWFVGGQAAA